MSQGAHLTIAMEVGSEDAMAMVIHDLDGTGTPPL